MATVSEVNVRPARLPEHNLGARSLSSKRMTARFVHPIRFGFDDPSRQVASNQNATQQALRRFHDIGSEQGEDVTFHRTSRLKSSVADQAPTRRVNPIVKILVFFHIFMIASWSTPKPADAIINGVAPPQGEEWLLYLNQRYVKQNDLLNNYLTFTGLWQGWDMFAPNPADTDLWLSAEVTYRDGSKAPAHFPRIKNLSIPAKYFKERYRKYYERANQDDNAWLWPSLAQRLAFESDNDPSNPPVSIALTRHWRKAKPPGQVTPEAYLTYTFYEQPIDPSKLRQVRP